MLVLKKVGCCKNLRSKKTLFHFPSYFGTYGFWPNRRTPKFCKPKISEPNYLVVSYIGIWTTEHVYFCIGEALFVNKFKNRFRCFHPNFFSNFSPLFRCSSVLSYPVPVFGSFLSSTFLLFVILLLFFPCFFLSFSSFLSSFASNQTSAREMFMNRAL